MLTPGQVRLRLQRISYHETNTAMADLIGLLEEVLLPLVATSSRLEQTSQSLDELLETGHRVELNGRELREQSAALLRHLEAR